MNCPLFERQKGRLIPVPEAFFLLDRANEILEQVDDLKKLLKSGGEATPTKINVSSMPVFGDHFLLRIIAEFSKKHPKANFQVAVQGSPEVISSMETQRFDVVISERGKESDLIHCQGFDIDCVCALPKGGPAFGKIDGRASRSGRPSLRQLFARTSYCPGAQRGLCTRT